MTTFAIDGLLALPIVIWIVALVALGRSHRVGAMVRATLWAAVLSELAAHANRWLGLWPSHPHFPSGHLTIASCFWTALVCLDRRYSFAAVPHLALLSYALVAAKWHGKLDVLGGFLLGSLAMAVFSAPYRRFGASTESSQR